MTRRFLATALLATSLASVFGAATPASANCDPVYYELTGDCENACTLAGKAIRPVYEQSPVKLPEHFLYCTA